MKKQSDSNSDVKYTTIQFHRNSYNSQASHCNGLTFYVESPNMLSYLRLQFQVDQSSERHCNTGQSRLYEFCYLLPFDLRTFYMARILLLQECGRLFILLLQECGRLFWESPSSTRIFNGL
jgi:hypothetical protein